MTAKEPTCDDRGTRPACSAHLRADVPADPAWDGVFTEVDSPGMTPLFWTHITPYGEVRFDVSRRLSLDGLQAVLQVASMTIACGESRTLAASRMAPM